MKKVFNFQNFGILCAAVICCVVLSSYVKWSAPLGLRNCYAEIISIKGHDYIIATTGASDAPGVSIIHAESCPCKNKR